MDMLRTEKPTQHVADIIAMLNKELEVKKESIETHAANNQEDATKAKETIEDTANILFENNQVTHNEIGHGDVHPIIEIV